MSDFDRASAAPVEKAVSTLLRELEERFTPQQIAAGLAEVLHYRLSVDCSSRRIPYSQPSEMMVRVVLALVAGGTDGEYIANKLRNGISGIVHELGDNSPEFQRSIRARPEFAGFIPHHMRT